MFLRASVLLAVALSSHGAFAGVLQGSFEGGGHVRIVTKGDRIATIVLELPTVRIPFNYFIKKSDWPDATVSFGGVPATMDDVAGWTYIRYLSPKVSSQVTLHFTGITATSTKATIREKRTSSAGGYKETFLPQTGHTETTLSETPDPYSGITVTKVNVRRPVHRAATDRSLELRIGGMGDVNRDIFQSVTLELSPLSKSRWKLSLTSWRRSVNDDVVGSRRVRAELDLHGTAKINPAFFD